MVIKKRHSDNYRRRNKDFEGFSAHYGLWKYFVLNMTTKANYTFKGRASRKEFWGVNIFAFIITFILNIVAFFWYTQYIVGQYTELEEMMILQIISAIVNMLFIMPETSVMVRRLHDMNMSGWWSLAIIPILLAPFKAGTNQDNQYGRNIYINSLNELENSFTK